MTNVLQNAIKQRLEEQFNPIHIEVLNESYRHAVPKNAETHFKVVVISEKFDGRNRIQRQRLVQKELAFAFDQGLHALTQHLYTNEEWQARAKQSAESPNCMSQKP